MFDLGSATLKPYTQQILHELANYLNHVPNRISLTGHTDITAYSAARGYGNWELSADRANAARRALVDGGLEDSKITRVVGLSSSVLFDKADPQNPINRRISIVVMTKAPGGSAGGCRPQVGCRRPPPTRTCRPRRASGISCGCAPWSESTGPCRASAPRRTRYNGGLSVSGDLTPMSQNSKAKRDKRRSSRASARSSA